MSGNVKNITKFMKVMQIIQVGSSLVHFPPSHKSH